MNDDLTRTEKVGGLTYILSFGVMLLLFGLAWGVAYKASQVVPPVADRKTVLPVLTRSD